MADRDGLDSADRVDAERHASWLELFVDLVVVVAVAQLAHRVYLLLLARLVPQAEPG